MLRALLPFFLVQFIQSRLLRIALLPRRESQGSTNHSVGTTPLHWHDASAKHVMEKLAVSTTTKPWSQKDRALVQWPLLDVPFQQWVLRFEEISPVTLVPFSRSTTTKVAPSVTKPLAGSFTIFHPNADLKLLEAPSIVECRALVLMSTQAVTIHQTTPKWTEHPFRMQSQPLVRRLQDLSLWFVHLHLTSQPMYGFRGATCSAARDQRVSKQEQRKQSSERPHTGKQDFFSSGRGCTQWFCSCVLVSSKYPRGFPTHTPDFCGSNERHSQALTVQSSQEAFVLHRQQKAAARMYKQARQLLMMKQALKRDAEISVRQLSLELKHVFTFGEDAHAEYCNFLMAAVTLVILLAMSQKTAKSPHEPASTWNGAMQFLPALTLPPTLSEGGPALQRLQNENADELKTPAAEPERSCEALLEPGKVLGDGDFRRAAEENCVPGEKHHEVGEDAQDELLESEENGNMDDKEVSEKHDDQDEVSSCVSSCGTSDGYEKLEIGGSIFMDEEDANECCT
jgi:hypothetical protein